jgi:hypothetical protein
MQAIGISRMSMEELKEDLDRPIWGVKAIAMAANLNVRQALSRARKGLSTGEQSRQEMGYHPAPPS